MRKASLRHGFTLVEILVVITIIGLVAAVALPAIGQALARARNAAIKTELDMLHLAVMNYRNEYGSFPTSGTHGLTATDPAGRHLLRLFPRTANVTTQLQNTTFQNVGTAPAVTVANILPANALPLWLYGYTNDPTQPVYTGVANTFPRAKLFDFDATRLSGALATYTPRMQYFAAGKPGSAYVYIAAPYGTGTGPPLPAGATIPVLGSSTGTFSVISNNVTRIYGAVAQITTTGTTFFNPETFQILSAGRDEIWGTEDDLSNFWPSTRGDYVDNLAN